jgi:hypothetical protein
VVGAADNNGDGGGAGADADAGAGAGSDAHGDDAYDDGFDAPDDDDFFIITADTSYR